MQFIDLISSIYPSLSQKKARVSFVALRSDPLIWKGVSEIDQHPEVLDFLRSNAEGLTPGTLAEAYLKVDFPSCTPEKNCYTPQFLEGLLMSYENYIQDPSLDINFKRAAELATVLVEKNKVGQKWVEIISEILNRMNIKDSITLVKYWGSIFGIVINLLDNADDLLVSMLNQQNPLLLVDLFIHVIRCLVGEESDKLELLSRILEGEKPDLQAVFLRKLKILVENDLVRQTAQRLLKKYIAIDLKPQSVSYYWERLEGSMSFALKLQAIAEIAAFAGEEGVARKFNQKAMEALDAVSLIVKIRQSELRTLDEPEISWHDNLSPEVARELLFSNIEITTTENDKASNLLGAFQRARKMESQGNNELAQKELRETFSQMADEEIRQVFLEGPRYAIKWDPEEMVDLLVRQKCNQEALRIIQLLLEEKPADANLNRIAFDLKNFCGEYDAALSHAQLLFDLDPHSQSAQRRVSEAYARVQDYDNALRISKMVLESEIEPETEDRLHTAEYCIKLGENEKALSYLQPDLESSPKYSRTLTLAGIALKNMGEFQKAVQMLERAVHMDSGDPEAWMLLSELLWQNGDKKSAIEKLKEGIAAVPGNTELEFSYAKRLVETGSVADAFPFLRSLSERSANLEIDLMLLDVMKKMGDHSLLKFGEDICERYPHNPRVYAEMGTILANSGRYTEALTQLKNAKSGGALTGESQIAYLQSLVNWNYQEFQFQPSISRQELLEALSMIEELKLSQPGNGPVSLIEAETLLVAKEFPVAFELFSQLMKNDYLNQRDWFIRRNTGLALCAREIKKLDLAEAAINEVIEVEPAYIGLKRITAEIQSMNGKNDLSLTLANSIYEEAAENPLVVSWYADLLRKNDQEDRAEVVISKAIARNPKNLSLILDLAEPRWLSGDMEKSRKGLEAIKPLLGSSHSAIDMVRVARGFALTSDLQNAELCLQKAATLGGMDGILNLAGFYRAQGSLEKCSELLFSVLTEDPILSVFLAEVLSAEGKNEEAIKILESLNSKEFGKTSINYFFPQEWERIINAHVPGIELHISLLVKKGKYADAFDLTKKYLGDQSGNLEVRAIAIECSFGAGRSEELDGLLQVEPTFLSDTAAAYYRMLWNERALDSKDIALVKVYPENQGTVSESIFEKITSLRLDYLGGDLDSAEKGFQETLHDWKKVEQSTLIQKVSILRNLLKAAQDLSRWGDVVWLLTTHFSLFTGHQSLLILGFQMLIKAIEFRNRFVNMDLTTHFVRIFDSETLEKLLNRFLAELETLKIEKNEKLVLRGRLALNPSDNMIRELATYAPEAEDAASLMSALRRNGQSEIAVKIARKFQHEPVVLFELALAESDIEQVKKIVNEILDIDPENPLAYWLLSDILLRGGSTEDALKAMEVGISYWKNEPKWHVKTAELWAELGNYEKQVDHLHAALETAPEDEELHVRLGKAMVALHDLDNGLEHLRTAVGMNPNRSDVWTAIAEAHEAAGDLEEAILAAQKAAETDMFSNLPWLISARIHLRKGDLDQAFRDANKAVEIDASDAEGYLFLSKLHLEKGDKLLALEDLEKASNSRNTNVQTMIRHAQLLKELKGAEESRSLLESFTERYPENPELLKYLAEAEKELGNLEYAQSVARRALDLQPENAELHRLFGKIMEKSGNLDQAALSFSKSIAFDPKSVDGYLDLSQAFYLQREYNKARQVLEEGIDRNPREIRLLIAQANICKEAKDYTLAEQMLRRASEIEPRNLDVHRQLGAVLALNMIHQSQEASVQP